LFTELQRPLLLEGDSGVDKTEIVRLARAQDFHVGVAEEVDAQRVALSGGPTDSQRLRWGLQALLCSEQDEWERFDELFDATGGRPTGIGGTSLCLPRRWIAG
jgi:uncharacterized protein with von Willebrand factor type A (vWA) domain